MFNDAIAQDDNAWLRELDTLTRFHVSNVTFKNLDLTEVQEAKEEEDVNRGVKAKKNANISVFEDLPRVSSIGRGRKQSSKEDNFMIARQIEEAVGSGHRESVFSSCRTSSKSGLSGGENQSSFPKETKKDGLASVTLRPQLVRKNGSNSSSQAGGGQGVAGATMGVATMGVVSKGRGKKLEVVDHDLPSGAVASLIEKNVGQGHRLDLGTARSFPSLTKKDESLKAKNSNNNNFPIFDYENYQKMSQPAWWVNATEIDSNVKQDVKAAKVKSEGKAKVERAVLSTWIPLDDSVELQD